MKLSFVCRSVAGIAAAAGAFFAVGAHAQSQSLLAISLTPSGANPSTATQFYSLNASTNDVITSGRVTGGPATPVLYGLGVRNGALYTFDSGTDRVLQLSQAGAVLNSINIGVGNLNGEGDLDFNPLTGTGYLASSLNAAADTVTNDFFSFNILTGTSTRIATTSVTLDGLAFNAAGVLYGLSTDTSTLYTVNLTTGALTAVGSGAGNLGFGVSSGTADIAFAANGTLYAALDDQLFTLNTATGAASLINPDPQNPGITAGSLGAAAAPNISGLAFVSAPEPGALALILPAFAGLYFARRRSK